HRPVGHRRRRRPVVPVVHPGPGPHHPPNHQTAGCGMTARPTRDYPKADSQRGKLYAAERAAFTGDDRADRHLTDAEVSALADRAATWARSHGYPATRRPSRIRFPAHGTGGAWASGSTLMFTPPARRPWIV